MKILKIFGIVVGIHVFALVLIFANPGCSSSTRPPPSPADTAVRTEAPPMITVPEIASAPAPQNDVGTHVAFNPDAPATYGGTGGGIRFNPTRPNTPAASAVLAPPVTDVTPAATYTVKAGDSLWSIAKRHHISYPELATANNLRPNAVLQQGQKLIIPGRPTSGSATAAAAPAAPAKPAETPAVTRTSGGELRHVVKSGETLGAIARRYDVKVGDIAVRNNITDPQKVRAGTELIIPGWKSTAAKTGKGASDDVSTPADAARPAEPKQQPINILDPEQNPPSPNSVPVIPVDENPITPASKS